MRKILLFACALFGFMACTQNPIEEQPAIRTDAPETLRVGFEDDETRIQLNEVQKTVWTKDDLVSVFYRSDANQKWQYQGESGERVGDLKRVENATSTTKTTKTVVVYPYSESYWLNTDSYAIDATLPATQYYAEGSYGVGSNLMVSQSEFTQFSLKSVCGWLKLQLTGDGAVVKSIKFRGNDGEQVAGLIYVDTATAKATLASEMGGTDDNNAGGNLVFDDTILTEVVLDCGEGVELGAEATSFYISLPPQTFANGFTVDIECEDYELMTLTTEKELVIERNHIQPMASVEHNAKQIIPNNEIWYTNGSTTEATTPYKTDAFGANIVSNTYDAAKECWVIKFDGDVTAIEYLAFHNCSSLTSVTIPDSVTLIGNGAFWNCSSLQEFKSKFASEDGRCLIIDGVLNSFAIGCGATEYTIPDSVTSIGRYAFEDCESLTSVTIPDSVTTIGERAFYECTSLTSVTIPDSVISIENYAFGWCESLTSVTIGDSVTTIGEWTFNNCSSLTSITIPDSVTSIGDYAFQCCSSLQEFNGMFASEDGRCLIIDGVLNSFAPAGLTEYTIPDSVTTIGERAFAHCRNLTNVTIPDSVTEIGIQAFAYCDGLTSVTIGDSVTTIRSYALEGCYRLTSVYCKATTPPAGDSYMFSDNASGSKIYVPMESVEAYKSAEYWSEYATDIVGYDFENGVVVTPKPANNEIWYTNNSTTYATAPANTDAFGANIISNTYDAAKECWVIKFDGDVTSVGFSAFYQCSDLTSVVIPDSVTSIGDEAFLLCSNLTSVSIPDNVTEIGGGAFAHCFKLQKFDGKIASEDGRCLILNGVLHAFAPDGITEYTIPNGVTTISLAIFESCSSLKSVTIPDSVTTIGDYAFNNCSSLTSVIIPNSVTSIGEAAFYSCDSLTSVTIGDRVTTIGGSAFSGCSSLTSVTIGDSVTSIGSSAFDDCSSLPSITIPDSVTTIGNFTFSGCSSLTSITILDSVTSIGNYAFINCCNLTSVYCEPTTPPTGGTDMFYNISSDCKIYVPMESVEAYKSASGWKKYAFGIVGYNF